ncbi:MAG: hypothetical protein OJF60_001174 [Burkholderiaceae bacterium]|nr:MAG: hypothetical protein OJF60_001174 [Burkholderiaceae bacterium]
MVLHDLRFVVDGDVAQIDHLIIDRALGIYLIETKNYAGNLIINEQGEFTAEYDDDQFGIPSPIEQSRRHERVLVKLLERLEITGRMQMGLEMIHLVMLHPKAIIRRPPSKTFDTSAVIKADQFPEWHKKFVDGIGAGTVFKGVLNMRSLETIKEWGEKLKRQHQPADLLALPEFMQPSKAAAAPAARAQVREPTAEYAAQPSAAAPATAQAASAATAPSPPPQADDAASAKRLICAECGQKISFAEGKYCWNQAERFGGRQYCREHQKRF